VELEDDHGTNNKVVCKDVYSIKFEREEGVIMRVLY